MPAEPASAATHAGQSYLEGIAGSTFQTQEDPVAQVYRIVSDEFAIPSTIVELATATSVQIRTADEAGSGVILRDAAGQYYVLTNHHVIDGEIGLDAPFIEIVPYGSRQGVPASIRYETSEPDLALLAIEDPDFRPAGAVDIRHYVRNLANEPLAEMEPVFFVGNPAGIRDQLRAGLVHQHSQKSDRVDYVAGCAPGASGAPIFDTEGRMVGLHTAHYTDTSLEGHCRGISADVILDWLVEAGVPVE